MRPPRDAGPISSGGSRCTPWPRVAEVRMTVAFANSAASSDRILNVRSFSSTRSHLFAAISNPRPASSTRTTIFLSSDVNPSGASITTTATSARSIAAGRAHEAVVLDAAGRAPVVASRRCRRTGRVRPATRARASTLSRVVPASSNTTQRSSPTRRVEDRTTCRRSAYPPGRTRLGLRAVALGALDLGDLGKQLDQPVEQVAGAAAVQGRDGERGRRARACGGRRPRPLPARRRPCSRRAARERWRAGGGGRAGRPPR